MLHSTSPRDRSCSLAMVVAALITCGACAPAHDAKPLEPAAVSAPSGPVIPGREQYELAKQAIMAGDVAGAKPLLEQCTKVGPQVCEYWYQLGAAESNLAIDIVNQSESEAVRMFGDSVDHKREAMRLLNAGQCPIWTDAEREQARSDGMAGLADAEAVLNDPVSLVAAMKMYAAQRGR